MSWILLLLGVGLVLCFTLAIPLYVYYERVGTEPVRERRRREVLACFDGRPEIRVRIRGTGMTPEQTVWLASRHGYEVSRWPNVRGHDYYVVMRRIAYVAPLPDGQSRAPSSRELQEPASQLIPASRFNFSWDRAVALYALAVIAAWAAWDRHQNGESVIAPGVGAVVFLAAGIAMSFAAARRPTRTRQRETNPVPAEHLGPQPPPNRYPGTRPPGDPR